MKQLGYAIFILLCACAGHAQDKSLPLSLSVFNNGTALPGQGYLGVFSKTPHPGVCIGTAHNWRSNKKSAIFQTLRLGYFYHRHAQQGIQLYSELGYRLRLPASFYTEALIGAGYLHSFAGVAQFTWKDGTYVKKTNLGRPQVMSSISLAAGYDLGKATGRPLRLFVAYQFWLQAPFVNKYVPLLPNTSLHIGAVYNLPFTSKKDTP